MNSDSIKWIPSLCDQLTPVGPSSVMPVWSKHVALYASSMAALVPGALRPGLAGVNGHAHARPGQVAAQLIRHIRQSHGICRCRQQHSRAHVENAPQALLARHRAAGDAKRTQALSSPKRRPEADERPERERKEHAVAGGHAGSAIYVVSPDPEPPVP